MRATISCCSRKEEVHFLRLWAYYAEKKLTSNLNYLLHTEFSVSSVWTGTICQQQLHISSFYCFCQFFFNVLYGLSINAWSVICISQYQHCVCACVTRTVACDPSAGQEGRVVPFETSCLVLWLTVKLFLPHFSLLHSLFSIPSFCHCYTQTWCILRLAVVLNIGMFQGSKVSWNSEWGLLVIAFLSGFVVSCAHL